MRVIIQRVKKAECLVKGGVVGFINKGMVVFLGVRKGDELADVEYLAEKIVNLRIFSDEKEKMNFSLLQVKGEALVIPQFTLYGNCRKGLRPNFVEAASTKVAQQHYLKFIELMKKRVNIVENGQFGAKMRVVIDNDGPVTLIVNSKSSI